jgi:hypothetical protein
VYFKKEFFDANNTGELQRLFMVNGYSLHDNFVSVSLLSGKDFNFNIVRPLLEFSITGDDI